MHDFRLPLIGLLASAAVAAMSGTGVAQESTTATYDDWVVQCRIETSPAQKICAMAQITQVQGKNLPFSRVEVQHPTKGQPVRLVVQVPVNVSLAADVRIQTSDSDPGVTAPFARCVPAGCFAEFEIKDDALRKFHATKTRGKLSFKDSGGHEIVVPLSFRGFNQAFDVLATE